MPELNWEVPSGTMEGQRKGGWDEGGPPSTEKFAPTRQIMNYE